MAGIVYLDLETADADRLWDYGPGFVRLAGFAVGDADVVTTTDIASVVEVVQQADIVVGHNVLGFDLAALERYHGLDLTSLVAANRVVDTLLVARQNDPPLSGKADVQRYNLEAVCRRVLGVGKVAGEGGSALKALAREHGGYDQIPVNHPDYVRYLVQDVHLVRELSRHLVIDDYLWREHKVMWRLNHISKQGFRVDVDLVTRLVAEREARLREQKEFLHREFGLPLDGKKPHTTTAGKLSLEKAFSQLGIEPPRTEKGALATGKEALEKLEAQHRDNEALVALCQALRSFNGDRSMAQTLLDHTSIDGRIHPSVSAGQATGRISVTKPGLTVLGKRDRSNVCERAMLLPDVGDVLIGADLAQVDARAIAIHAQDAGYIAALEPGKDMHSEMAAAVFGEEGWNRQAGQHPRRADAKAITHATTYGMGAAGLALNAGISEQDARRQLAALDAQFPALAGFKRQIREEGKKQIICNAFGRRMRVAPGKEYTQAPAHIGQGTARDLMMQGILRLPTWLLPCLRAVVHDEIVLSVPEHRADEAEKAVLEALQFPHQITPEAKPVPVLAQASDQGRDWLDCYRSEKPWPEVSRAHREQAGCDDPDCTWHQTARSTEGR
ncbi:DNA polymerase [Nesterenkonia sp. Act20]|uniref:DNA polymerase n=1 Tax=Nesterenkonia sp. Act20 TaxID=1483432 RepID=UPI001C46B44E|nr:DNA polymerase [Nesterenkonia sp. Act20]